MWTLHSIACRWRLWVKVEMEAGRMGHQWCRGGRTVEGMVEMAVAEVVEMAGPRLMVLYVAGNLVQVPTWHTR